MLKLIPAIIAISLTACASNPGEYDKVFDVAGKPGDYQGAIKSYMATKLKDASRLIESKAHPIINN